jgi:hypothetical protein
MIPDNEEALEILLFPVVGVNKGIQYSYQAIAKSQARVGRSHLYAVLTVFNLFLSI